MNKSYIQTIYYFLREYRLLFIYILLLSAVVALLESFSLAALLPVINSLLGISEGSKSGMLFVSIDRLLTKLPFEDHIISAFAFLIILTLVKSVLGIFNEFLIAFTTGKVMYKTKDKMLKKYSRASYLFFLDTKQGALLYNVINAPKALAQVFYKIPRLILELLKVIAIIILLLYLNVYATLVLILLSVVFNFVIAHLSNRLSYWWGKERVNLETQQATIVNELFNGIKQIVIYGAREKWESKFEETNKKFTDIFIKDFAWAGAPKYAIDIFGFLIMFSMVVVIKKFYPEQFINSLPIIGIFAMALVRLLPSLGNIGRLRMEIAGTLPDAEVLYAALNTKFPVVKSGDKIFDGFNDAIVFEKVSFAHKGCQDLLRGIDIRFKKNETTAIIGAIGSGKTTIVNLILGLFHPTSGRITIDGTDLREYMIDTWREKIGFVSQDTFIFHSTIADNISLGIDKYSRQDIIEAAKLSGADEFITKFSDGYDTIVGERGMKLSGGQQQCIAIARAIIKNPQLLILDEATSAVDNISEKMLQESINSLSKNHTVIMIAHRLSTIKNADKIVVLKDGIIKEEGTHAELISRHGFYRHMHMKQE